LTTLGEEKQQIQTVVGVEVRTAPLATVLYMHSYGDIAFGFEVMRAVWPKLEHVFSVKKNDGKTISRNQPGPKDILSEPHQLPNNLLENFPVDLLTIEHGFAMKPPLNFEWNS
jgi:hypothetical protein